MLTCTQWTVQQRKEPDRPLYQVLEQKQETIVAGTTVLRVLVHTLVLSTVFRFFLCDVFDSFRSKQILFECWEFCCMSLGVFIYGFCRYDICEICVFCYTREIRTWDLPVCLSL